MKHWLALFMVLVATTAFGQTRVLTNADLGKPLDLNRPTVDPAILAALAAHQFVSYPTYDGPHFYIAGQRYVDQLPDRPYRPNNMSGPWDWPRSMPARRLDGTLLSQPPTVYGVPSYWPMYGNHVYGNPYPNPPQQRRRR